MKVRNIAIVGGGPSAVAAAKYILAEKAFDRIVIFEQRSKSGGIWNYTPETTPSPSFQIPQTNPRGLLEHPIWRGVNAVSDEKEIQPNKEPIFVSPIYDQLETNIPRSLMRFSDWPFPEDSQLFPKHQTVLEYLRSYAKDVLHLIKFHTQVKEVSLVSNGNNSDEQQDKWRVQSVDLLNDRTETEIFDAVIAANGHFNVPYIPDIKGIREWTKIFPNSISHSIYYRRPEDYAAKKVVVVGNSASGLDIGSQIATVSQLPVLQSQKSVSYLSAGAPTSPKKLELPPISSFEPLNNRTLHFENGHIEENVDSIVFCTGYFYSFPFLSDDLQKQVVDDGTRTCGTYQHLFFASNPTLSFLALPQKVIPFHVAEVQAAVLARVYSGRLSLPTTAEMQRWEEDVIHQRGAGGEFHTLQFPKDADYINELWDWAMSAGKKEGLSNDGHGKISLRWGPWERWCRERFPAIRKAFTEKGEERSQVRTLDELGFVFSEEGNDGSNVETNGTEDKGHGRAG